MHFPDTRWTLVAQLGDEATAGPALEHLCAAYWRPIYAYLLRSGHGHTRAQDLTQEFLEMVVRQRLLERARPTAGKLRAWLLASLQNFLSNVSRDDARQKRGAGVAKLPLDDENVLAELAAVASPGLSPGEAFDRVWIAVLLRRVLDLLAQQYQAAGKEKEFAALLPSLLDDGDTNQTEAAARAGMAMARFRLQLHRLRGRYREGLRREITATLDREEDYADEVAYLFRIMGRSA